MTENNNINVLIAEDDFLVLKEIDHCLKETGYNTAGFVSNGEDAVKQTEELKPDVVLMDINMPRLNGLEASLLIQKKCPTPIVIVSAYESQEFVDKASSAGVGAYLTKPVHPSSLSRAITIAVARHKDLMKIQSMLDELSEKNKALEKVIAENKILSGMLPICAECKKIRDDDGYWNQIESYIQKHSKAQFSHGLCPGCADALYGNEEWYRK